MAKKARKAAAKRGKKSKVKKSKVKAAKKTKVARKKKKARRKAKPGLGARISTGFHNVVDTVSDTVSGTGKLRKKMEQPGSDETERRIYPHP